MAVIINDVVVNAEEFAFDGCHKFYLIAGATDKARTYWKSQLIEQGRYEAGDIYPISCLREKWDECECELRFMNTADLSISIVPQFYQGGVDIVLV